MRITKKTICPLDCPDSCGMLATIEGGKVVSLAGDPDHPYTNGFICRKMRRYPERVYSPERILYPQIRVGAKGAGLFKRISWDEAWNHIVPKLQDILQKHGGESVLPFSYAGNMGAVNRFAGFPLFHRIGAIQTKQTICTAAARGGWELTCGDAGGSSPAVAAESELIIDWGINIRVSNVHFWRYVKQARKAGARLLVIDPYVNDTARVADEYIQVQPGGDSALALGILKTLLDRDWLDHRFLEQETEGFEELADYLRRTEMSSFESQSGVKQQDIERVASLLRKHPKTFIRIGVGLSRNSRGGMAIRAITSLAAACGLFDGQQGRGILLFSGAFSGDISKLTFPELAPQPARIVNMIHLGQALTTVNPAVKALIVYNANPVSVVPDGTAVRDGLCREDLFTIVHEQVMSPTARFADILLPATTFLENRDIYTGYGHFYLGIAGQAIEPCGEAMSNFDFFQAFAAKMGYTDAPFSQKLDERIQSYLASISGTPDNFSTEHYRDGSYIESIYNHQNGSLLKQRGNLFRFVNSDDPTLPPYACLTESSEFDHPDLTSRFPFKLITPPNDKLLNSTFGEMYQKETGEVLIHPEDAVENGIEDGTLVKLFNFRGSVVRCAAVSEATQKGLLVAEGIYWPPPATGAGINDLVSQKCSDVDGGALFHESRVQLSPWADK